MAAQANRKKKRGQQAAGEDSHEWLHQVAFWALAVLLFFPPYFRGLFFAPEQEKTLLFAALVLWAVFFWRWLQRDYRFLDTKLDWFALALPLVYIISSFLAVNKGLAAEEVVKNILYFFTFWSVSRLVRHEKDAENIIKVIYLSAAGVALAGLATATGIIHIKDGFLHGRIYSTYQYPNALASFLGGIIFLGTYLWYRARELHKDALQSTKHTFLTKLYRWNIFSYLYACGNFLLLAVLFGTKSKGGLLVFALVFIIYLAGAGAPKRLAATLHLGYLGGLGFVAVNKFIPLAQQEQAGQAWLWIAGGLLLALAGHAVWHLLEQRVFHAWAEDKRKLNLSFAALAGIAIIAAGIWLTGQAGIVDRATGFFQDRSALQRVQMIETAYEMTADRPVLGWGGGGWQEAYKSYMDYRLSSREAHSYYLQVGVETGVLGLLAVAGIWCSFLYLAYRLYFQNGAENPNRRQLAWALAAAFLMIAGHALIDFDLSLSSLTMVLWSIFGIAVGLTRQGPVEEAGRGGRKYVPPRYVPLVAVSAAVVLVLISGFCLALSRNSMQQGIGLVQSGQAQKGIEYMERATGYAPFRPGYHQTLAQVYRGTGEKEKAVAEAERAVELSRYNIQPRYNLIKIAAAAGDNETAAKAAGDLISLDPNERSVYKTYGQIFNKLGLQELKAGNKEQAREYFTKATAVPELMDKRLDSLGEKEEKLWSGPRLKETREISLHLGKAHYWLGDLETAEKNLTRAAKNKNIKGEALMYRALLKEQQGREQKAANLLQQAEKASPGIKQQYEELKGLMVLEN